MLVHRTIDAFLHRFAQQPLSKLLFEQRERHFALPKALQFNFGLRFCQFLIDLGVKLTGTYHDRIFAFKAFFEGLSDLHICLVLLIFGAGGGT